MQPVLTESETSWQQRLDLIVETMREMSLQTDPQEMVHAYGCRMRGLLPSDRHISLSRRGLAAPRYRMTRNTMWPEHINPWKEPHRLPLLDGGLLGELIYGNEPRIINDLIVADDDPAAEYLSGMGSLMAIPHFDGGEGLNMVVNLREMRDGFDPERLPELTWLSSLFGRATHNLVLSDKLQAAYAAVDRELKVVADIQRSLLPRELPKIPTLDLAAYYQTSRRAGGDYYDFFPLPDDRWGILLADVSGHGTPAAVMMAITHSIAHAYPGPPSSPKQMLSFVNERLSSVYTSQFDTFVTAFYGVYDPRRRVLDYASAGHNPPRLKRAGAHPMSLDGALNLPLGIRFDERFVERTVELRPCDQILFYTDGITEAEDTSGDLFGLEGLDRVLSTCHDSAQEMLDNVLAAVEAFTAGHAADDDRTLIAAQVE